MGNVIVSKRLLGLLLAGALASGCAAMQSGGKSSPALPKQMVSGETLEPALYLSAEAGSPVLGFLRDGVVLDVLGPARTGRVPVRVRSAMQVRAYVPAQLLSLHTQRHGRVRGTPVYLAADNVVQVVGEGESADRLRVRAAPRLGTRVLAPFEGTYPAVGLGVGRPSAPEPPPAGAPYQLPANTPLKLFEKAQGELVTELAPQPFPVHVRVLSERGGWYAVRIGDGPFLVGYTQTPMQKATEPASLSAQASAAGSLPKRLASEAGELRRVAKGARVSFDGRVIAKLDRDGYARVLNSYPTGEADALVAVDDDVAVRGLIKMSDLLPAQ